LLTLMRSLPQQLRTQPVPPPPSYHRYLPGPGARFLDLIHTRNLSWNNSAKLLFVLGGIGPWSAATVGAVGRGRRELSPELLAGFAAAVDIPARDLAALVGTDLSGHIALEQRAGSDTAELIWEARRLTSAQMRHVADRAHAIRHEVQHDLPSAARCHCGLMES
jgi:hypothetical protein